MVSIPGLSSIQARKRELLLESDINRQVIQLELDQIQVQAKQARESFSGWKWAAPLAGFVVARKFAHLGGFLLKSGLGMYVFRKLRERFGKGR